MNLNNLNFFFRILRLINNPYTQTFIYIKFRYKNIKSYTIDFILYN